MKTRTLGLVAGMVLVAASAGFLQTAELNNKSDMNSAISSNVASGVPGIFSSLNNSSAHINSNNDIVNGQYVEINENEMTRVHGEVIIPWWYLVRIIFGTYK